MTKRQMGQFDNTCWISPTSNSEEEGNSSEAISRSANLEAAFFYETFRFITMFSTLC